MNTTYAPQRPSGIPDTLRLPSRDTRTSIIDRIALHIGLRLLLWGSRAPRLTDDREGHARARRNHAALTARQRGHLREALVLAPRS
jgi:hypothetical protein